jgi:hypothetical protein
VKTPGSNEPEKIVREPKLKKERNHLSDEKAQMHFENDIRNIFNNEP